MSEHSMRQGMGENPAPRRRVGRAIFEPVADVFAWRRIALEQQLPNARFPAGVGAPARVSLVGMLLIAALCAGLFAANSGRQISGAVRDSQHNLVEQLVRNAEIGLARDLSDLDREVSSYRTPDELFTGLMQPESAWTGATVVDLTRNVKAAKGEKVTLPETLDAGNRTVVGSLVDGKPSLTVTKPLPDAQVLVATLDLRFRTQRLNPQTRQALLIGDATTLATLQGSTSFQGAEFELVRSVVNGTIGNRRIASATRETDQQSGALLVTAGAVGATGLTVVSATYETYVFSGQWWEGGIPAATLAMLALIAWFITRKTFERPILRLLERGKRDACGDPRRRLKIKGPREAVRIAAGLKGFVSPARGIPVMVGLITVCAMTIAWSVAVAFYYNKQRASVPDQTISDLTNQAESVGREFGGSLDLGYQQVLALSAQVKDVDSSGVQRELDKLSRNERRFRSLYTLDRKGNVARQAGRAPLRVPGLLPGEQGVWLDRTEDRVPLVFAFIARGDGTGVVGEFDIDFLTNRLRHVDGRVQVIDSSLRTILDTDGYIAFSEATADHTRRAAISALSGQVTSSVIHLGPFGLTADQILVSTPVTEPTSVAHLEWVLVVERSVGTLAVPEAEQLRTALLTGGLASGLALFVLGWQYFALVRPLRALARDADEVATGIHDTPVSLRRPDEIGAIAACLEICRQVAMYGAARFGGAIRMRGSGDDFTNVIPAFGKDR